MTKTNTIVQSVKNSNGNAPAFDKLTKAELIELLSGDIKNPMKDFPDFICRIKDFAYLCCARTMRTASQSTYSNAIKRCPLSTSAMQLCRSGEQMGATPLFVHIFQTFNDIMPERVKSVEAGNNSICSASIRTRRGHKLPAEYRDRFISYFLRRYPETKRIKVSLDAQRHYTARSHFRNGRTFIVRAYSYEALVIYMHAAYSLRGFEPASSSR